MMGKVIITGPGRAGTTFLVQLLTRLGYDTGYSAYKEDYDATIRAGCEHRIRVDLEDPEGTRARLAEAPRVLKAPEWSMKLKWVVQAGLVDVDLVIIPIRDLDEAAASRLSVGLDWWCAGEGYQERLVDQANIHALALGRALEACMICLLPCVLLRFPDLVQSAAYLHPRLDALEALEMPDYDEFEAIYNDLARPEQIEWTPEKYNQTLMAYAVS